jgi:hypothetical protein
MDADLSMINTPSDKKKPPAAILTHTQNFHLTAERLNQTIFSTLKKKELFHIHNEAL